MKATFIKGGSKVTVTIYIKGYAPRWFKQLFKLCSKKEREQMSSTIDSFVKDGWELEEVS